MTDFTVEKHMFPSAFASGKMVNQSQANAILTAFIYFTLSLRPKFVPPILGQVLS